MPDYEYLFRLLDVIATLGALAIVLALIKLCNWLIK